MTTNAPGTRHPLKNQQAEERRQPTQQTRDLPGMNAAQQLRQQGKEAAARGVHADQVRPLLDGDHQRQSEGVAAQHRTGDER
jgi:hypothetical protein